MSSATDHTDTALLDLRMIREELTRTVDHWDARQHLDILTAIKLHQTVIMINTALTVLSDFIGNNGGGHPEHCGCLSCDP